MNQDYNKIMIELKPVPIVKQYIVLDSESFLAHKYLQTFSIYFALNFLAKVSLPIAPIIEVKNGIAMYSIDPWKNVISKFKNLFPIINEILAITRNKPMTRSMSKNSFNFG